MDKGKTIDTTNLLKVPSEEVENTIQKFGKDIARGNEILNDTKISDKHQQYITRYNK